MFIHRQGLGASRLAVHAPLLRGPVDVVDVDLPWASVRITGLLRETYPLHIGGFRSWPIWRMATRHSGWRASGRRQ